MQHSTHLLDRVTRKHYRGHAARANEYVGYNPNHTPKHRHDGAPCMDETCIHDGFNVCVNVETGVPF